MKPHRPLTLVLFTAAASLAGSPALADFTVTSPGGSWGTFGGQNFIPSVDATPDAGLAASDPVYLTNFTFTSSGQGTGASDTHLVIFDSAYPDIASVSLGDEDILGISTNHFDTNTLAEGAAMGFAFDNVALTYGGNYAAVFATISESGVLTFLNVSALQANWDDTAGAPATNYGGGPGPNPNGYWNTAALWRNAGGWYDGFGQGQDTAFTATFAVPEPATLTLAAAGLALLARRRTATHR